MNHPSFRSLAVSAGIAVGALEEASLSDIEGRDTSETAKTGRRENPSSSQPGDDVKRFHKVAFCDRSTERAERIARVLKNPQS